MAPVDDLVMPPDGIIYKVCTVLDDGGFGSCTVLPDNTDFFQRYVPGERLDRRALFVFTDESTARNFATHHATESTFPFTIFRGRTHTGVYGIPRQRVLFQSALTDLYWQTWLEKVEALPLLNMHTFRIDYGWARLTDSLTLDERIWTSPPQEESVWSD